VENEISQVIIGAAIEVQRTLGGSGLLESIYEDALCHEMILRGVNVERQLPVDLVYKGKKIRDSLVLDLLVEKKVIVEVKATIEDNLVFGAQLLTYLRLSGYKLGLLINFGKRHVKDGIERVVNGL
jgi:GxxExxY protein